MQAVEFLHNRDYKVYAIEQVEGSIALQSFDADKDKRYAVILGNEVKGVQQQVVDACDGAIEIPQFGTKHSLNVSVTGGMVIWEFARKMGWVE
jgi:tRNA G18 (ribose-2'-O)-methylase SpoU